MRNNLIKFVCFSIIISCQLSTDEGSNGKQNYYTKPRFDFSFYPSNQIKQNIKLSNQQTYILKAYLKTSTEQINLSWKKLEVIKPEPWMLYFCDNTCCFFDFPDSNQMKVISLNDHYKKNPLKLYIEPHNTKGKGQVKVLVYEKDNPDVGDTIIYNISFY